MIGAFDDAAKMPVAKTERINVEVYCVLKFINRKPVGTDRIPQANEHKLRNKPPCLNHIQSRLLVGHPSQSAKPLSTKSIPSVQNFALKPLLWILRVD